MHHSAFLSSAAIPASSPHQGTRQRGRVNNSANIEALHELIAALDHRLPQVRRAGEAAIAQDAASLKAKALERIAELEHAPTSVLPR
jgi:hypothetical protein